MLLLTMVTISMLLLLSQNLTSIILSFILLVFLLLSHLTLSNSIHPILPILITIIYIGAMMISLSYLCAISPNPLSHHLAMSLAFSSILTTFTLSYLASTSLLPMTPSAHAPLSSFLYSISGVFLFFIIILFLLLLLYILNSYTTLSGPLRSLK